MLMNVNFPCNKNKQIIKTKTKQNRRKSKPIRTLGKLQTTAVSQTW